MTPEEWRRIERLYHAALEWAPDQRAGFLNDECAGDGELRRNVEGLLKAHEEAGGFLAGPALEAVARAEAAGQLASPVGSEISHYRILSRLGAGGMGEVYLARDLRLDRTVALKILPARAAADADWTHRFVLEARVASALNHPNVATIYDVGETDGQHFIAMEYVEGQTLAAAIDGQPQDPAKIVEIGMQVADALGEAHARGITHRDIKPANIMVTRRGQVKVLDFGLAKITRDETGAVNSKAATRADTIPGLVMGTAQYMSPEQVLGRPADHRSDIFSLGVVLYEMATGRPPFAGATPADTMGRVLNVAPEPVTAINHKVPAGLAKVVHKCLEKDPGRRYQSAGELLADLGHLQSGGVPITAGAQQAVLQRRSSGSRLALAVLTLAALSTIAGLFLLTPAEQEAEAIESVAVLPFVNVDADPELEYLADGITENIISNLSQISQLKVMSRTSVFRYKGREVDPQRAGRELNVRAVLAGRVLLRGDQLGISLELIDVSDSRQLWGDQYNRNLADLLRIQTEIAREVSDNLRLRLTGRQQQQLAKHPTGNIEAYELYLRGRFYRDQLTEDGFKKAIDHFQQATDKDPNYALAYVGLADAYIALGADYMSPGDAMPKAREYALKAIELDKTLAEAHSSLGVIHLVYDWDWTAAAAALRNNLALSPLAVDSFSCSFHFADPMGRNDEAIASIKRALVLDPFSLPANLELGCASYFGRHYDQAIKQLQETLNMYPGHAGASYLIGRAYGQKMMYAEAIAELTKVKAASGDWPPIIAELGYAYGASGNRSEAEKMLDDLRQQSARRYVDPYLIAVIQIGMGEEERTFAELDRAYRERSSWLPWLTAEPKWDALRSDSRFIDLVRRVGLAL
jgi:serine/threonine protein kinase/tetratricopeptide (TPR) repeat protein